jgi:hypothetical protein
LVANYRPLELNFSLNRSLRNLVQLAIVEADTLLERIRSSVLCRTNYHISGMQQQLFFLSMWVDRRLTSRNDF